MLRLDTHLLSPLAVARRQRTKVGFAALLYSSFGVVVVVVVSLMSRLANPALVLNRDVS